MSRVEELTKELTEAITDSCEYKRFKEFESEVMKRPDLKRALDDFRRENFRMQYSEDTGDVLSATQELEGHFADIRQQPEVEGYLAAEMELCRMVQEICMSVVEAVDFNMDFLQ